MGSIGIPYSVPREAETLFRQGILRNTLMPDLPSELERLAQQLTFEGNSLPSIPMNWRLAESISALKAFEATMVNCLLARKYKIDPVKITINTDHASLFIASIPLAQILDDKGTVLPISAMDTKTLRLFRPGERPPPESLHQILATNIYKTRDERFYHVHGSMNPAISLGVLGLPSQGKESDTFEEAVANIQNRVIQFDASTLDELMNEQHNQAGITILSQDEYFATAHGKENGQFGLYEIIPDPTSSQPATWWPDHSSLPPSPERPLAGLKVVDLTRVIAGPTITRGLAELGASVMRVTSPSIPDFARGHQNLNWGKWNCHLHLKDEVDKERLRKLILESDVVVDGYRPGVMDRLDFGREAIFELARTRERGIIHLRENCYGWHGPWAHRSGWQGISDACCGVALSYGQAMGVDEAVVPPFPNSDHCTGVVGCTAILHALIQRAERGGSYGIDTALNYYSQWLVRSCGTYPEDVWSELWKRNGSPVFHHYENTRRTLPRMVELFHQHHRDVLLKPAFFEKRRSDVVGSTFINVRPVAQYSDDIVKPGFHVATRGNGVDQPCWPSDLATAIVV